MKNFKRRDFIKSTGIISAASLIPFSNLFANETKETNSAACVLIPSETAGPFSLDLTSNAFYFRKDVRENKTGVQLNLKLKIVGLNNCLPMSNVRVNIWHCDKDGLYSGYNQNNNQGQAGLTYLRGYQITDSNGEVEFITILPGWYTGRICHIHFQVYVSTSYSAISQLTFDIPTKNSIYSANPNLYTKGIDPLAYNQDNIFADGYAYQLATLNSSTTTSGYESYLEINVQGSGTSTGIGHTEKENLKNFQLLQNYPNPFIDETTIPFVLYKNSKVSLDIFNLQGQKVYSIKEKNYLSGKHEVHLKFKDLTIATESYAYQLTIENENGIYIDSKLMQHLK